MGRGKKPEPPPPPPGGIEAEAALLFRGQGLLDAIDALRTWDPGGEASGRLRIQRAVLKLSKGRIRDLYHYLEQARMDWRDVLYWAEYYEER